MTLWLERKEKVLRHDRYLRWCEDGRPPLNSVNTLHKHDVTHVFMTREPSAKAVPFTRLADAYGATQFSSCLAQFIVETNNPGVSHAEIRRRAARYRLPFNKVPVYHKAKFWESDFPRYRHASDEYDVIHAKPSQYDTRNREIPGQFDTALVNMGDGGAVGVHGTFMIIYYPHQRHN